MPAAGVFQGLHNIQRVLFTGSSAPLLQKEEAGDKQLGRGAALRQLAGLLVVLVLGTSLLHNTHGHGAFNARYDGRPCCCVAGLWGLDATLQQNA